MLLNWLGYSLKKTEIVFFNFFSVELKKCHALFFAARLSSRLINVFPIAIATKFGDSISGLTYILSDTLIILTDDRLSAS